MPARPDAHDRAARVHRVGPGGGGRQAELVDSTAEEVRS
jgi:hypothetical protein